MPLCLEWLYRIFYVPGLWIFHIVAVAKVLDLTLKDFQSPDSRRLKIVEHFIFLWSQWTNITVCNLFGGRHNMSWSNFSYCTKEVLKIEIVPTPNGLVVCKLMEHQTQRRNQGSPIEPVSQGSYSSPAPCQVLAIKWSSVDSHQLSACHLPIISISMETLSPQHICLSEHFHTSSNVLF